MVLSEKKQGLTKKEVLEALEEGRVTCNISGSANITPQEARKLLLANLDRAFDPRYAVDLSFEDKYAHLLNGKEEPAKPQKVSSNRGVRPPMVHQNCR